MRGLVPAAVAALSLGALIACSDPTGTSDPGLSPDRTPSLDLNRSGTQLILMWDKCDPKSFNAAIGAGTCERKGEPGVPFEEFLAQVGRLRNAPLWRFDPAFAEVQLGTRLIAQNRGGEVHTFTEVEHFGGGIVPILNQLSDNNTVAPECLALEDDDFVPPRGTYTDRADEVGVEHYQCCIHPWMRTTIRTVDRRQ